MILKSAAVTQDELGVRLDGGHVGPGGAAELSLGKDVLFGTDYLDPCRRFYLEVAGASVPDSLRPLLDGETLRSLQQASLPATVPLPGGAALAAAARIAVLDVARGARGSMDPTESSLWALERLALAADVQFELEGLSDDRAAGREVQVSALDSAFISAFGKDLLRVVDRAVFLEPALRPLVAELRALAVPPQAVTFRDVTRAVRVPAMRGESRLAVSARALAWRVPLEYIDDGVMTISREEEQPAPVRFRVPISSGLPHAVSLWARAWRRADRTLLALQQLVTATDDPRRGVARLAVPLDDALPDVVFDIIGSPQEPIPAPGSRELQIAIAHARYAAPADRLGLRKTAVARWSATTERLREAEAVIGRELDWTSEALARTAQVAEEAPEGQTPDFAANVRNAELTRRTASAAFGAPPSAFLAERHLACVLLPPA